MVFPSFSFKFSMFLQIFFISSFIKFRISSVYQLQNCHSHILFTKCMFGSGFGSDRLSASVGWTLGTLLSKSSMCPAHVTVPTLCQVHLKQRSTKRAVGRSAGLFRPKSFCSFSCSPSILVSLLVDL